MTVRAIHDAIENFKAASLAEPSCVLVSHVDHLELREYVHRDGTIGNGAGEMVVLEDPAGPPSSEAGVEFGYRTYWLSEPEVFQKSSRKMVVCGVYCEPSELVSRGDIQVAGVFGHD